MRIVWDEPKRLANIAKHGLNFADLTLDFFSGAYVDRVRDERLQAIGLFQGRPTVVIFALVGSEAWSIVSMRAASRKERRRLP
jgi:uncharacterized DUF497 family protein